MATMEAQAQSHVKQLESKEGAFNKLQLQLCEAEAQLSSLSSKAVSQATVDEMKGALQKSEAMRQHEQSSNTQAIEDGKGKVAEMERELNAAVDARRELELKVDELTHDYEYSKGAATKEALQFTNQIQVRRRKKKKERKKHLCSRTRVCALVPTLLGVCSFHICFVSGEGYEGGERDGGGGVSGDLFVLTSA